MIAIILLPYNVNINDSSNEDIDDRIYNVIDLKKRPWLHNVDEQFIFTKNNMNYVFDDVSIYYYLKYKNIDCDYIFGNDPDIYQKILKYTHVLLLFFDQLQAFHTLPYESYQKIKPLFLLSNILPKYTFQHFIYHKNIYFDFLQKEKIHILPFLLLSSQEECDSMITKIKDFDQSYKFNKNQFYIKPIFGQNSIDHLHFSLHDLKPFQDYISIMKNKYKSFIIQPYIQYFYHQYEYRNYFIGNNYVYTIRTKKDSKNKMEFMEEYIKEEDCKSIVQFSKNVFEKIKKKNNHNLVLRIDVSYDDHHQLFVSEIEFVPYLFTYIKEVNELYIDQKIGDHIIQNYTLSKSSFSFFISTLFLSLLLLLLFVLYFYFINNVKKDLM